MKTYIVSHLGQEIGPHTEEQLINLWDQKQILPIDYVFDEEKQDWFLITDIFDWAQHLTSVTALHRIVKEQLKPQDAPPSLDKVEKTLSGSAPNFKKSTLQKPAEKVIVKEDPPPSEVILRRPKNISYTTQFNAGQAKIDLTDLAKNPGAFELREIPGSPLKFKEPFSIEIRPATAKKLAVRSPQTVQAGQTINVKLEATDENGHFCPNLDGFAELSISIDGSLRKERIQILKGLGHFSMTHLRAEKISFEISSLNEIVDNESLKLQTEAPSYTQVQPGPATHMSFNGDKNFVVGQEIKIELQAVDQFGNFVKNFSAKIDIEANKATASAKNKIS